MSEKELLRKVGAFLQEVGANDHIMWHRHNDADYPWVKNRPAQEALEELAAAYAAYRERPAKRQKSRE